MAQKLVVLIYQCCEDIGFNHCNTIITHYASTVSTALKPNIGWCKPLHHIQVLTHNHWYLTTNSIGTQRDHVVL